MNDKVICSGSTAGNSFYSNKLSNFARHNQSISELCDIDLEEDD